MGRKINRIGKIPVFIKKLKDILDDKKTQEIICWLPEENGFQILNNNCFTQKILPQYFKHQNLSSFVRQLNMYGFNRPKDSGNNIYIHPRFSRRNLNNMKYIKRKQTSYKCYGEQNQSHQISIDKVDEVQPKQKIMKYLHTQNQELKKQNRQLHLRLNYFQQILSKLKLHTNSIDNYNYNLNNENLVDKESIQVNSLTDHSISSLTSSQGRKGFSICKSNSSRPYYQQSYQFLVKGTNKNQEEK